MRRLRGDPGLRSKTFSFFCINADRGLKIYSRPYTLLNKGSQQKPCMWVMMSERCSCNNWLVIPCLEEREPLFLEICRTHRIYLTQCTQTIAGIHHWVAKITLCINTQSFLSLISHTLLGFNQCRLCLLLNKYGLYLWPWKRTKHSLW